MSTLKSLFTMPLKLNISCNAFSFTKAIFYNLLQRIDSNPSAIGVTDIYNNYILFCLPPKFNLIYLNLVIG